MAQGSGLFHLMPPPFYAYRMVVAKARSPEESIQGQIDKIVDATATTRYKIEVMPGIYAEAITMKAYVDVVAPYGRVIIRPPSGTTASVTMASNSMLQGLEIDNLNCDASCTAIVIGDLTNVIIEDCWVTYSTGSDATDIGISDASTGTSVIVRKCRVDSVGTCYRKTAAGTTWFADNRLTATTNGTDVDVDLGTLNLYDNELMAQGTGYNLDVAAAAVTVNSFSNSMTNSNTTGAAIRIGSNDSAWVYSSEDNFLRVVHSGLGHMVCAEDVQTFHVYNGMKIADAITRINTLGDASDTKRYLIHIFAGEYSEALTMPQYVDLNGESAQSVVISQAAATVIACAANSRVRSVRVEVTAADATDAVVAQDVYAYLEDVTVVVTHSANVNSCLASAGTGGFEVHDCFFQIDNAVDRCLEVDGSGSHFVYDSELVNSGAGGYAVFVGAADSLSSFNNKLRSDGGFYLTSDAATLVLSYGDDYTTVVFSAAAGEFADLTGCKLYSCLAGVAVREWVYVSGVDTVAEAQANALATMPSIGVVVYKPSATTCYVKQYGYVYDAAGGWATGQEYWVSAAVAGAITTVMPVVWPQMAGVAASTQRFKILLGPNLGLVHCNTFTATAGETVGEWVCISAADTVDEADANNPALMNAVGMIVEKPDATTAVVKTDGKVYTTGKGWAPNNPVYISDTVPGDIVNVPPVMGVVQRVGTVVHDDGLGVASGLLIEIM